MNIAKNKLFNPALFNLAVQQAEGKHGAILKLYKSTLRDALGLLRELHSQGVSSAELIERYTWLIDQLIGAAWTHHQHLLPAELAEDGGIELVAVGGYGRHEMHPYSDVDLLLLLKDNQYDSAQDFVEHFLRFLWDIGLQPGHSVRSSKDCIKEARADITVMTNLLEARHLCGDEGLFSQLDDKLRNGRIWSPDKFYAAKYEEQLQRAARYQGAAYSLEPNLKENPGGLRDLQTILWVYNRHFGVRSFREMHEQNHIDSNEYRMLVRARNMLWKMRAGLHFAAGRREDRLLFDSQRQLAEEYGYEDNENHLAVEQLMKRYYRTVQQIRYLNEVLLANYRISHISRFSLGVAKTIDDDFVLRNKLIEQRQADLFQRKPGAMLRLFRLMQKHRITGIHPDTIRAIRSNLGLINSQFRADPENRECFISLFRDEGIGLTNALARMNAYGVLGAYLPTFGAIVGQMQHDLFHVYTVDGHTLMVMQHLTRLRKYPEEFPIASNILQNLYRPERLFAGALFHDIAKGRGGDHSVLGERDAYKFCIAHGMSEYDAKLVGWLVLNHLFMSHFSQRRDISDPEVIAEFAEIVGDIEHLDNLYLLTLADIRGTSPKVWNAWKGQLLLELYKATSKALRRGIAQPLNEEEHVEDNKASALVKLQTQLGEEFDEKPIQQFWSTLPSDYFIRNEPYYIAWHAASLFQTTAINQPIVSVRYSERLEAHMVFIFAPESKSLLTRVTWAFDSLDMSIVQAQLQASNNGFALYSFNAQLATDEDDRDDQFLRFLERRVRELILLPQPETLISRRKASRALKHFPIQPKVNITQNNLNYTVLEVVAQDQPGLLHNVAMILRSHNLKLVSAKISTFGEKAEDVFYVQRHDQQPVSDPGVLTLVQNDIIAALDSAVDQKKLKKAANA